MTVHSDENVTRHREALEAFNRRDMDGILEVYGNGVTVTDHAQQQTLKDRDGVRAWNQAWLDGFSDGKVEDIECIGMGEWTVARFVGRGTNDGPLGNFEPTNRRLELALCDVSRWQDGKVVEQHFYYDMYGMLAALGHVPPMPASA